MVPFEKREDAQKYLEVVKKRHLNDPEMVVCNFWNQPFNASDLITALAAKLCSQVPLLLDQSFLQRPYQLAN